MKKWDVHYKGHTIRVENSFAEQRLFVDDELQDELYGAGFRSRMYGEIRDEDAAGEEVKVSLGGTWQIICRIVTVQPCEVLQITKPISFV